ncbi:MAG: nitrate reductase [Planctomycetota bacterium]|nr:MAG: nitrate reductase [Planctomycetota bacterium]
MSLLHQTTGPLTRELLLAPGSFGLGQVPERVAPDAIATIVCGYCSTGCGLNVHMRGDEAVSLTPRTEYPVNLGMACPKGWEALTVLKAPDRATSPLLRDSNGKLVPVDWPLALTVFKQKFQAIQVQHGPESVAFLGTGQMTTEELAFLGSLAKFGMGMRHGDGNTRQCMATAAVAYKQSFGFDAPPYTYADFEESDTIVLIGSNLCIAHPIMWERVMRNPHKPQIIVIDPRRTETAMAATLHLPAYPKSDQTLLYGVARELIHRGWIDRKYIEAHTSGFEAFAEFVEPFTLDVVSTETGLSASLIEDLVQRIHNGKRVSFWWTMGVNQSHQGVRTAQAIINLALMTGNMGRPGTGANSITGQCNAMGSRLFSNTSNLLGGRDFTKPEDRAHVANLLGIDEARIPTQNSWTYSEILDGILKGKIKGLWVVCTNTAHSWINQDFARDVLSRLDFLVVQDMYSTTETAQMADLVLPAAGWGEKDGTFINSERRVGVIRKVARAPGQALSDFSIFRLIAETWGCGEMFQDWTDPQAVFRILQKLSAGQPCDITGLGSYAEIDAAGGVQWPVKRREPAGRGKGQDGSDKGEKYESREKEDRSGHPLPKDQGLMTNDFSATGGLMLPRSPDVAFDQPSPERRLFEDGHFYHADGRAKFLFETPRGLPEPTNDQYPLLLLTGRGTASQWHTQTRTSKSAVLRKLYPESIYLEINPVDARSLGIKPQDRILVRSRRGEITAVAVLVATVPPGQVFLPMHYVETNRLTDAVFDPYSKQPAYKACAVQVTTAAG